VQLRCLSVQPTLPTANLLSYLHSASCGAVYCNRSCLWVCDSGRAVSEPYYSQRAQCLRLSARFFHLVLVSVGQIKLSWETCIDDERQFKTAKRPQEPSGAIVRKRDNFVTFRRSSKGIAILESVIFSTSAYMQIMVTRPLFGTIPGPISAKCLLVTDCPD